MTERLPFKTTRLPKEVVVIDGPGEKRLYLLKCSRRRLGELLEAALHEPGAATG